MNQSLSHLITAPWTTMIVFAAVRLDLFTLISDKSLSVPEIAQASGSDAAKLEPLLRACAAMEMLESQGDKYKNSNFSQKYLVEGKPGYVGDLIKLQFHEWEQWKNLANIIKKENKITDSEESIYGTFIRAMNNLGQSGEAEALTAAVDLSSCSFMVDVGGGSGIYSVKLCQKYPGLQVVLLDKKQTLEVARDYLQRTAVQTRITLRETDIEKERFGENMDAVLLSDVIYDTRVAPSVLQHAHACLKRGGQLIVRGYYSDPAGEDTLFSRLFVLQELVFDPEREVLTLPILKIQVEKSGFQIIQQEQLTERSQILIAKKV